MTLIFSLGINSNFLFFKHRLNIFYVFSLINGIINVTLCITLARIVVAKNKQELTEKSLRRATG